MDLSLTHPYSIRTTSLQKKKKKKISFNFLFDIEYRQLRTKETDNQIKRRSFKARLSLYTNHCCSIQTIVVLVCLCPLFNNM